MGRNKSAVTRGSPRRRAAPRQVVSEAVIGGQTMRYAAGEQPAIDPNQPVPLLTRQLARTANAHSGALAAMAKELVDLRGQIAALVGTPPSQTETEAEAEARAPAGPALQVQPEPEPDESGSDEPRAPPSSSGDHA